MSEKIKTSEVAKLLGVSGQTVLNLSNQPDSDFPRPVRIGCQYRWNRDEVVAWVESRQQVA